MTATADEPTAAHEEPAATGEESTATGGESGSPSVQAGRVGRAHGLDGSFYVTGARPRLLEHGTPVKLDGSTKVIVRRAGTDEHPIVRVEGIQSRSSAEAVRGMQLSVDHADAPSLGDGEWWAGELEGCVVVDGDRTVGVVARLVELPSCEALEVRLDAEALGVQSAGELLVPMVRDAVRNVDMKARRIDVDMSFLEEA